MTLPTHPGGPGGQQDQGHGVVLHDQGEVYQQPISFMRGSSIYLYFGLVPIDSRSSYIKQTLTFILPFVKKAELEKEVNTKRKG